MAGKVEPLKDVLNQMKLVPGIRHVRLFNNQFKEVVDGKIDPFVFPCLFLEDISTHQTVQIGAGFATEELIYRIYIGKEFVDAMDGTMDQDLTVFLLRDAVIQTLQNFLPTACTPLLRINEEEDFNHTNIYVYKIDFRTALIDSLGSDYDPNAGTFKDFTATDIQPVYDPTIIIKP